MNNRCSLSLLPVYIYIYIIYIRIISAQKYYKKASHLSSVLKFESTNNICIHISD